MASPLRSRRVQLLGLLSIPSGMPLGWMFSALQVLLVNLGIPKSTIGFLSSASLPWNLKLLWSPLVDRFALPWPGRRRSWVMVMQLALAGTYGVLAAIAWRAFAAKAAGAPLADAAMQIGLVAVAIAFLSATHDIALDAYAVEVLHRDEQVPVSGLRVMYYRIGMLLAGNAAVSITDAVGWPVVCVLTGAAFVVFVFLTLAAPEPDVPAPAPRSLAKAVIEPIRTFFGRPDAGALALFLVFYKFGDNMAGTMVNPFLKDLCFTNAEFAVVKTIGIAGTIGGAAAGAALMTRMGLGRALWIFGVLQAGANVVYSAAAMARAVPLDVAQCAALPALDLATRGWTYGAIASEYTAQGMAAAAQGVLLLRVCDRRYAATQFALLTSLFGMGRWTAGIPSGVLVERLGYPAFFVGCATVAALPGFLFLARIAPLRQREVLVAEAPADGPTA